MHYISLQNQLFISVTSSQASSSRPHLQSHTHKHTRRCGTQHQTECVSFDQFVHEEETFATETLKMQMTAQHTRSYGSLSTPHLHLNIILYLLIRFNIQFQCVYCRSITHTSTYTCILEILQQGRFKNVKMMKLLQTVLSMLWNKDHWFYHDSQPYTYNIDL